MKIVCDSCGAKYSIADEKVQGKVFKIRCKKCSNVIVVKGTGESEAAPSSDGGELGAGAGAAEWYVVIDGEQVGPVTTVEIDSYFMSGQINAETYAWKDGMGDWQHIVEIPEFAHLGSDVAGPNEATTIADSGQRYEAGEMDATNVVQSPLAMEGSDPTVQDSASDYADDPYASDPGYGDDEYGYAASSEDDGGYAGFGGGYDSGGVGGELAAAGGEDDAGAGMFAAFDTGSDADFMNFGDDAEPASNGANGSNGSNGSPALGADMVGQRNENSVLFSLSSLDSVPAAGEEAKQDTPVTEGSGLIDIQALASAHKSMSGSGEVEEGGGIDPFAQGTMAMPALMPMGSHKSNNTLYIALAVGGLAVLGLGVFAVYMVMSKDDTPQEQQVKVVERIVEKVVESPAAKDKAEAEADEAEKAAQAAAAADPKKPEADEEETEEAEDDKKSTGAAARRKKRRANTSPKKDDDKPAPKAAPKKSGDGIDDLLSKIDKKAPKKEESSSRGGKKSLSRNDVKQTINRYNSRINTCARSQNKSGKKGTVKVKFYIRPNGRVRGAKVVSSGFKGTDVGACVQKVVGSMTFPKTTASKDVPVTYPFILK